MYRGDVDESKQATVDWSWGTVRYRLGSSDDDEAVEDDSESVSSPQPTTDVHTTELQVRLTLVEMWMMPMSLQSSAMLTGVCQKHPRVESSFQLRDCGFDCYPYVVCSIGSLRHMANK